MVDHTTLGIQRSVVRFLFSVWVPSATLIFPVMRCRHMNIHGSYGKDPPILSFKKEYCGNITEFTD